MCPLCHSNRDFIQSHFGVTVSSVSHLHSKSIWSICSCGQFSGFAWHLTRAQGRKVLCPHHQLWSGAPNAKVDRDSYRRAVQRLRAVLTATSRTLFVLLVTLRSTEALEAARDDSWSPTGRGVLVQQWFDCGSTVQDMHGF